MTREEAKKIMLTLQDQYKPYGVPLVDALVALGVMRLDEEPTKSDGPTKAVEK